MGLHNRAGLTSPAHELRESDDAGTILRMILDMAGDSLLNHVPGFESIPGFVQQDMQQHNETGDGLSTIEPQDIIACAHTLQFSDPSLAIDLLKRVARSDGKNGKNIYVYHEFQRGFYIFWFCSDTDPASVQAKLELGILFAMKSESKTAVKWLERASQDGSWLASTWLGSVYFNLENDLFRAYCWYQYASQLKVASSNETKTHPSFLPNPMRLAKTIETSDPQIASDFRDLIGKPCRRLYN